MTNKPPPGHAGLPAGEESCNRSSGSWSSTFRFNGSSRLDPALGASYQPARWRPPEPGRAWLGPDSRVGGFPPYSRAGMGPGRHLQGVASPGQELCLQG